MQMLSTLSYLSIFVSFLLSIYMSVYQIHVYVYLLQSFIPPSLVKNHLKFHHHKFVKKCLFVLRCFNVLKTPTMLYLKSSVGVGLVTASVFIWFMASPSYLVVVNRNKQIFGMPPNWKCKTF